MKRDFFALADKQFDLLVCGGGIYGAWTAYDAALRGLKVTLVEQSDWAGATSSASSKLIHGGLRYLESYDFKLVKKSLKERAMLLETAPHRVWPLRFGVPIYSHSRISRLKLKAGLFLYDLLAASPFESMKHRYFNRTAFAQRFTSLSEDNLLGGFTYADAQTDDSRLVLELVSGAMNAGAFCVNQCKLIELIEENGTVTGATLQDRLSGQHIDIRASSVVNTSGQWLTQAKASSAWCRLSKGIHLILPNVPGEEALLLTAKSDGRVFFIIPWYGLTLVGTTDTEYRGDIDHVTVEKSDVEYLLREVNHYLKKHWTENDVIGSYAGVRVMRQSDDASPSAVSRDWELKKTANGAFYSIGGKITSAREDATVIVDAVCVQLGLQMQCQTKGRKFPWAPENFVTLSAEIFMRAKELGIEEDCCKWLIRRHGKRVSEILRDVEFDPSLAEPILPSLPFIYADLLFCARMEMVVHLDDLFRRRMPLLILAKLNEGELLKIAEKISAILGWDEASVKQELASLNCSSKN
jgi:glycerol-3-phosphate dehydrogenase